MKIYVCMHLSRYIYYLGSENQIQHISVGFFLLHKVQLNLVFRKTRENERKISSKCKLKLSKV